MSKGSRVRSGRSRSALLERRKSIRRAFILRRYQRLEVDWPADADRDVAPCPVAYCGATGDEPCKTKTGADAKRWHKGRPKS